MTALLAVLAWAAAAYRLRVGNQREPGAWALPATLAALALGLTLKVPAVYQAAGDITGAPNLGQLLKDTSVVLSAFGTQVVLLHLLHPPGRAPALARRRLLATALTVAAMAAFFARAAPVSGGMDALRASLASPGLLEFRCLYLLFMAWVFTDIARLCWRFASLAGEQLLAAGLRLIAAGGAVGLAYVASGGLQVLAAGYGELALVRQSQRASDALIALAALLVVLGSTLPALASRLGLHRRVSPAGAGGATAGLETLWCGVTGALPDFVLSAPPGGGVEASERLYRQVIEVEDARLALRPLRDEAVERAAEQAVARRGVVDLERPAAVEGAALVLAVDRLSSGATPAQAPWAPAQGVRGPDAAGSGTALQSEVAWLSSVGRWYGDERLASTARELLAAVTGARREELRDQRR